MITLNDLLEITDVRDMTLYVPITPRVNTRIDFRLNDSALLDDITRMFGELPVKRVSPVFRGDPRMVVELGAAKREEGTPCTDPSIC